MCQHFQGYRIYKLYLVTSNKDLHYLKKKTVWIGVCYEFTVKLYDAFNSDRWNDHRTINNNKKKKKKKNSILATKKMESVQ